MKVHSLLPGSLLAKPSPRVPSCLRRTLSARSPHVLFIFLFLLPLDAHAGVTAGKPLSILTLAKQCDVAVIGRVASIKSDWNSTRTAIFTRIDLEVEEALKGLLSDVRVSFFQTGGQVGDIASVTAGTPTFTPGEKVFLFLSRWREGQLGVTGIFQGKFTIEKDPWSAEEIAVRRLPGKTKPLDEVPLEEVKRLVLEALKNQ